VASTLSTLLYHRVGARSSADDALTIEPERFRRHVAVITRLGYVAVSLPAVRAWHAGTAALPRHAVLLTFDDGYADLAEHAYPVLAAAGMPATTFVVTRRDRADWDHPASGGRRLLDAAEIVAWADRGMDFASHGRLHRALAGSSPEVLADEVEGSRADLADLLGTAPLAFAYPYGSVDGATEAAVAGAYPLAFGTEDGSSDRVTPATRLRRTMVQPRDTAADLALRLRYGRSVLTAARTTFARARRRGTGGATHSLR
jgi:peptidoglycan/xylan/chitin deacetylase (PgdA/CDA1 family)